MEEEEGVGGGVRGTWINSRRLATAHSEAASAIIDSAVSWAGVSVVEEAEVEESVVEESVVEEAEVEEVEVEEAEVEEAEVEGGWETPTRRTTPTESASLAARA